MANRINTAVLNNYSTSFYEQPQTLDETQTVRAPQTQENQSKPRKLPQVEKKVSFTALGCDTESKLSRAGYMALAAKAESPMSARKTDSLTKCSRKIRS